MSYSRGHDADGGARQGAHARLLPHGRARAARCARSRTTSRPTRSTSRRPGVNCRAPAAALLHVVLVRRLREGGDPSSSCRRAPGGGQAARFSEGGLVSSLPVQLQKAQRAFAANRPADATGLFSADEELLCVREDISRRDNTLDKVVGCGLPGRLAPARREPAPVRQPSSSRSSSCRRRRCAGLPDHGRGRGGVLARGRACARSSA